MQNPPSKMSCAEILRRAKPINAEIKRLTEEWRETIWSTEYMAKSDEERARLKEEHLNKVEALEDKTTELDRLWHRQKCKENPEMKNPPSVTKPPPTSVGLKGYRLTWDKTPTGIQAIVTDASTRVVLQRDFGHLNVDQMASQEAVIWRDVVLKRNPAGKPPKYAWLVINKDGFIASGWEFKQDAQDDVDGWAEVGAVLVIRSRQAAIRQGINPDSWDSWTTGAPTNNPAGASMQNPIRYVIESISERDFDDETPLYWSNEDGWVDLASADVYSSKEKGADPHNLPVGGRWVAHPGKRRNPAGACPTCGNAYNECTCPKDNPHGWPFVTTGEADEADLKRLEAAGLLYYGGKLRSGERAYFLTSKGESALPSPDYDEEHPYGFGPDPDPENVGWAAMARRYFAHRKNPSGGIKWERSTRPNSGGALIGTALDWRGKQFLFRVAAERGPYRLDMMTIGPWEAIDDGVPFATEGEAQIYAEAYLASVLAQHTFHPGRISRRNPAGLTDKGERMYEAIKTGYGRDPRAKEIAARTVYARAGEGAPGLVRNPSWPTVDEVTDVLKDLLKDVRKEQGMRGDGVEVRLQVTSKQWSVHYGDPGYDTDHHGYWGADFLAPDALPNDLRSMAKRLIEEAEEQYTQEID